MIEFIIICSLAFYGSKVTWQEGMIFEKIKWKLDIWFGDRLIRKPLYACPMCMPSIWGSIAYWAINYDGVSLWYQLVAFWLLSVFAMTGLINVIMYQFPLDD